MSDNPNSSNPSNSNPSNSASGSNPSDPSRSTTASTSTSNANTSSSNTNTNASNTESLTSRIQSSASNLARSALTSTPSDITALGSSAEKGSARPAGQTYYTQSTGSSSSAAPGHNLGTSSSGPGPGLSFRSQDQGQSQGEAQDGQFEAYNFQVDAPGQNQNQNLEQEQWTSTGTGKGKGKEAETDTFERVWSTQQQYQPQDRGQEQGQTYTQVPTDGSDVLTLLSSPTFNPDFPDEANAEGETHQIPDLSDYTPESTGLSPSELQTLESFRRSQGQGQSQPQTRITSTSLIPDIDDFLSNMPAQSIATEETQLRDAVLTGLSGSEDWVSVEERYHDEVWGFLKPVLQAAQKEIEAKEENPGEQTDEDGPAVARLKMILRHMRE